MRSKPRLTRQYAVQDESDTLGDYGSDLIVKEIFISYLNAFVGSPGRLTVRFLTTIPSAAENSMQLDDETPSPTILVSPAKELEGPLYAILHTTAIPTTPTRRQSIVTLHPISNKEEENDNEVHGNKDKLVVNESKQNKETEEPIPGPSR